MLKIILHKFPATTTFSGMSIVITLPHRIPVLFALATSILKFSVLAMHSLWHYQDWVKFGKKNYIVKFYARATGVEIGLFFRYENEPL